MGKSRVRAVNKGESKGASLRAGNCHGKAAPFRRLEVFEQGKGRSVLLSMLLALEKQHV